MKCTPCADYIGFESFNKECLINDYDSFVDVQIEKVT